MLGIRNPVIYYDVNYRCIVGNFEGSSWENIRNRASHFSDKIKQEMHDKTPTHNGDEKDDRNDVLHHSDKIMRTALFLAFLLSTGIFAGIIFSDKTPASM